MGELLAPRDWGCRRPGTETDKLLRNVRYYGPELIYETEDMKCGGPVFRLRGEDE